MESLGMLPICAGFGLMLLTTVVILYHTSKPFHYHTRFITFIFLSMIGASVPIPAMLLRPRDPKNALFPAWCARKIAQLLGIQLKVRGLENVVASQGAVVLINHQSAIDLFVLASLWPLLDRCAVISKKEVFYLWPFGLATWLWGTIFIDRLNPEKARSTVESTARAVKDGNLKLLMFPEGTRSNSDELLPFKKGAFHVAIAAQAPIQPVVVSRYYFLDSKKKIFDKGNSIISILPSIPTKDLGRDDLERLLEDTRNIMQEEHKRITAEVGQQSNLKMQSNHSEVH